jgi:2'-5' RNA ligase
VSLGDLGAFPDAQRARVLWLGLREGADALAGLHLRIAADLRASGVPVDGRPFRPHLTLARMARPSAVALPDLGLTVSDAAFAADEVVLFRSVLGPGGAVHTRLVTAALGAAPEGSDVG